MKIPTSQLLRLAAPNIPKQFFLENSSFLDIYSFSIPNMQRLGNNVIWKYI